MKNPIFLSLFLIASLIAQEKTFYLKTGDKITGTLTSETDSTLTLNTAFGPITINKSNLKPRKVVITLNSGDIIRGEILSRTSEKIIINSSLGNITIHPESIEKIENEESLSQEITYTPYGTKVKTTSSSESEEWFFSKERLMDIWFDPTGFTLEKNKFYVSGLYWGFGLNNKVQISTRFINYFWQDFNLRPKIMLFKTGAIESQTALSIGGHFHTQGLPNKYKWVENARKDYNWDGEQGKEVYVEKDGYVRFGAQKDEFGDWNEWVGQGDKIWYEVFGAFTVSKLRSSGNGRVNYTIGSSAIFYPDEKVAPRVYGAIDLDVTRSVKVMAEVFYDPYHVHAFDTYGEEKVQPVNFDIGFLTNKLPLFWFAPTSDNFWVGWHFQSPFITFYWKF